MERTFRNIVTAAFLSAVLVLPLSAANATGQTEASMDAEFDVAMNSVPVNDLDLSESRGAFSPIDLTNISATSQTANSSNNTTIGGFTGNNNINGGSFTNTQGLVNVIQNSGNNVVIQSSTIVNMTMINN